MKYRSLLASVAALSAMAAAAPSHATQTCVLDSCTVDLSTMTITYDARSVYSSFGGDDIAGYNASWTLPALTEFSATNLSFEGITFAPNLQAMLWGGAGASGHGEGRFSLTGLVFTPKAGYKIDSIVFGIDGMASSYGDAGITLHVPGAPSYFTPLDYHAEATLAAGTSDFEADFSIYADYQEGPNGTALRFGDAAATFNIVSLRANVSPVPEPSGLALMLAGGGLIALARRRRA
jgi:hypothetical protein